MIITVTRKSAVSFARRRGDACIYVLRFPRGEFDIRTWKIRAGSPPAGGLPRPCIRTCIPHTCHIVEWYDTTRNGACIRFARIPHLGILCPLAVIDSPGLPTAVSSLSHRAVITRGEDNLGMQPAGAISQRFPIFSARLHPPSPCRLSPPRVSSSARGREATKKMWRSE